MSIKLFTLPEKTVATAGTRVQVSATDTMITSVIVQAAKTNTGNIYVGDASVSATQAAAELQPGQSASLSPDASGRAGEEEYILSDVWLDASVSGDKAFLSYIKRR